MRHQQNVPRPLSANAIDLRRKLASQHSDQAYRDAIQRVRLGIAPSRLPSSIRYFLTDMGRAQPHNQHPFGRYPSVATELAESGTPFQFVIAPVTLLRSKIAALYHKCLPSIEEIQHTETNANCALDHAQLGLSDGIITDAEADAIQEAGSQQIAMTEQLLARVEAERERRRN